MLLEEDHTKNCYLCSFPLNQNKNCCVTNCNHSFHLSCILIYETQSFHCPLCNHSLLVGNNNHNTNSLPTEVEPADKFSVLNMFSIPWFFKTIDKKKVEIEEIKEIKEIEEERDDIVVIIQKKLQKKNCFWQECDSDIESHFPLDV